MTSTWNKTTKTIMGIGMALLGVYVLYLSRSVIPLLIIAALIAVIAHPLIKWLQRMLRLPRGTAIAVAYAGMAILVPLAFLLIIPAVVNALQYVINLDYESILHSGAEKLREVLVAVKAAQIPVETLDNYIDQTVEALLAGLEDTTLVQAPTLPSITSIIQTLGTALAATFGAAANLIGNLFSALLLVIFIFLSSIYFSLNAHTYPAAFLSFVPATYRPEISTLLERIIRLWNAFFRGQITLMLVIGTFSWLGLLALGVPGALSLGIIAGLLELIPNLGPIIATIPAVIVALLQGSVYLPVNSLTLALFVILFYVVLQQIENSVIVPRVLGDALDLPPLVVMTGVLVGGTVAGVLGALLATPVIGTAREILLYIYYKILDEDPFPPETKQTRAEHAQTGLFLRLRTWLEKFFPAMRSTQPADRTTKMPAPVVRKKRRG